MLVYNSTKKQNAAQEDEQLYLSWIKPLRTYQVDYSSNNEEKYGELLNNQEDEYKSLNNDDSSLDNSDANISGDADILNNGYYNNSSDTDADRFINELFINDDENSSSESLTDDDKNSCLESLNDYEHLCAKSSLLVHEFTNISKESYCIELMKLLREANVSKSHSKRFIQLIK
ncbi:unnamed protein product [Adineta steineri]|uniref:Uncharacterized protein n=1 Tax=Adineta steineri TaxID=433720 RepID=A0A815SEQ6_9BILA|nr:unnamed protein product [Adineta steineri]CAF4058898.1 unnamed protein product [Adineta steineri]